MKEVRVHARAGQGAITTALLLGAAVFEKGRYAYAFPHFGAARMGAPMNSFVRIDDREIGLRSQVYEPDYVLVVDPTLMRGFDVFSGLRPGAKVLVNQREEVNPPTLPPGARVYSVPADEIALEVMGRPLGNTALLGAFAEATGEFDLPALEKVIRKRWAGKIADKNVEAAQRGAQYVRDHYGKAEG